MMNSKFWQGASSDSESESSDAGEGPPEKKPVQAIRKFEISSDSDDNTRRIVKASRDRMADSLKYAIHLMNNHIKNNDIGELLKDYENIVKVVTKASPLVDVEDVPKHFVRALVNLQDFIEAKSLDKEMFKQLAKSKATTLNTLRSKLRKAPDVWLQSMARFREDPAAFELSDEDDDMDSSTSESSSDDELDDDKDESDSDDEQEDEEETGMGRKVTPSGIKNKFFRGSDESSMEESDWSLEEEASSSSDEGQQHAKAAVTGSRWLQDTTPSKKQEKAKMAKKERVRGFSHKKAKESDKLEGTAIPKDLEALFDMTDVSPEIITKRVQTIIERRGRRGVDRADQIVVLKRMAEIAEQVGEQSYLEVLTQLVTAQFDTSIGGAIQSLEIWLETFKNLENMLAILHNNRSTYIIDALTLEAPVEEMSKQALQKASNSLLASLVERLDDELMRSLQFRDVNSDTYKAKLGNIIDMVALHAQVYCYIQSRGAQENLPSLALRILEHMHNKQEPIAIRTWELVKKRVPLKIIKFLDVDQIKPADIIKDLVGVIKEHGQERAKIRAQLLLAFNLALHDQFYEAQELLQMPNMLEMCLQLDAHTQIAYNRALVQLGFCAFRRGLIEEALSYLLDICNLNRHRELLAQNVSVVKHQEKTPEQEQAEKRRLLPHHMHINQDLVEGVHNICAMLLEVPNHAQSRYTTKFPISRQFVRMLETYDLQPFVGPPESQREFTLAATKALQRGDWKECHRLICQLNIWDRWTDSDRIKEILLKRIKREAMRTFIFTYQAFYDSLSVQQLSSMFSLLNSDVHSIVSKMMVGNEIPASWDENSECIVINRVEPSKLQQLCLGLSDILSQSVDNNELTMKMKDPKFVMNYDRRAAYMQRDDRHGWGGRQGQQDGEYRFSYFYGQRHGGKGGYGYRNRGDNMGGRPRRGVRNSRQNHRGNLASHAVVV